MQIDVTTKFECGCRLHQLMRVIRDGESGSFILVDITSGWIAPCDGHLVDLVRGS